MEFNNVDFNNENVVIVDYNLLLVVVFFVFAFENC